jgi:hypothetical protein
MLLLKLGNNYEITVYIPKEMAAKIEFANISFWT